MCSKVKSARAFKYAHKYTPKFKHTVVYLLPLTNNPGNPRSPNIPNHPYKLNNTSNTNKPDSSNKSNYPNNSDDANNPNDPNNPNTPDDHAHMRTHKRTVVSPLPLTRFLPSLLKLKWYVRIIRVVMVTRFIMIIFGF